MSNLPEIDGVVDLVEIGRGGFGVVYRGTETAFGRDVAVKVLLPSLDERMEQRFERERRAMGAVSGHPNIVTVYRFGVIASTRQPYLVMEYLSGGTLADQLANVGPIDWRTAASIGAKLSDALAVAHRAGILHRDVKPANVFKTESGEPKLGDFGIARLDDGNDSRSGSITASIAHAPPEIIDGKRGDERSDIYSLASTVYTLAIGAPPFGRDPDQGLARMLSRITTESPPALHLGSDADEFERVLMRALSKRPEDRPTTITEFGAQLRHAYSEPTQQVPGPPPFPIPAAPLPAQAYSPQQPLPTPPFTPPASAPAYISGPVPIVAPAAPSPFVPPPVAGVHVPGAVPHDSTPFGISTSGPLPHALTPKKSLKTAHLAGIVAAVLGVAIVGGLLVARSAFGPSQETVEQVQPAPSTDATVSPIEATAPPIPTNPPEPSVAPPPTPTPRPQPTPTTVTSNQTVFTLDVGDCLQDLGQLRSIGDVDIVDCDEAHVNEVFYLFDIAESEFPGIDETNTIAEEGCLELFEDYVGRDFASSILNIRFLTPSPATWDLGDREVICILFHLDGELLTGSARGSGI